MKIALCLYGTIGGTSGKSGDKVGSKLDVFQHAFPHYKKFILDKNDVDVFIHSWDLDIEEDVVDNYKPKLSHFESQRTFDIPNHIENTQRVQNHFSRWYSCKQSLNLKKSYELDNNFKYDFVMLSRQDIAWQKEIIFSNYDKNYFYVPTWHQHHTGIPMGYPDGDYKESLQDLWSFANSEYMDELSELYDNISDFCLENKELTALSGISNHRLLYYKLLKMNIIPDKLKFTLVFDRLGFGDCPVVKWVYFGAYANSKEYNR
jgi:hypothetical protein